MNDLVVLCRNLSPIAVVCFLFKKAGKGAACNRVGVLFQKRALVLEEELRELRVVKLGQTLDNLLFRVDNY